MKRFAWLLIGVMLLLSTPVSATKLYIREYSALGTQKQGDSPQIGAEPAQVDQVIDFSGGVTSSAAFAGSTRFVRLWCDVQCSVKFGTAPTAANTNAPLSAGSAEYFGVTSGDRVSVITNP